MNKSLKFLLIGNSINILSDNLLIPLFALFVTRLGGGPQLAGILFGSQFVASGFGSFLMSRVKDRKKLDTKLLRLNFIIKGLSWLFLRFSQTIPSMFVVQIALGTATAIGSPSFFSLVADHLDPNRHIGEWSIWNLSLDIATTIGSFISGFIIISFGFTWLFLIMSALEFISLIVCNKT